MEWEANQRKIINVALENFGRSLRLRDFYVQQIFITTNIAARKIGGSRCCFTISAQKFSYSFAAV